jgi:hypothetical protein
MSNLSPPTSPEKGVDERKDVSPQQVKSPLLSQFGENSVLLLF